jgi:hypothetical protein
VGQGRGSGPLTPSASRVLTAGGVVAVLDGLAAVLVGFALSGVWRPVRTFQGIAAGVLGRGAFEGGTGTAAFGFLCHLVVACGWSLIYALVFQRWQRLREAVRSRVGTAGVAIAVGTVVWMMMSLVIVPLSNATPAAAFSGVWFALLAIHWLAVGLPIAVLIR